MSSTTAWSCTVACVLMTCGLGAPAAPRFDLVWQVPGNGGFSAPNVLRDHAGRVAGIVACEDKAGVTCIDLAGKRLWTYAMTPPVTAAPAVADVNGDGAEEIVAADGAGNLAVLDAGGKPQWTVRLLAPVREPSCPAVVDLKGDGRREILVGDSGGYVSCFDAGGKLLWRFQGEGTTIGPLLIADIYDLPGKEIIAPSHDNHIYALSAYGARLWDVFRADDLFPNTNPILADLDGDGIPALYIGGGLNHFLGIDLAKHSVTFADNVYQHINGAIAATDLEGSGRDEIVFGTIGGRVECVGEKGMRWKRELASSGLAGAPVLTALDGGRRLGIVFWATQGDLHAFDADGTPLLSVQTPAHPETSPLAGDFTGSGQLELLAGTPGDGGTLMLARLGIPYRADPRNRTMFAGDRAHSGQPDPAPRYRLLPTPVMAPGEAGAASAKADANNRLLSGSNTWRFDVTNPSRRRLALDLAIRCPDGSAQRIVRHVRDESDRVAITFAVEQAGPYTVTERLIDADQAVLLAAHDYAIDFQGFADDDRYVRSLLADADAERSAWAATNPGCAADLAISLASQRGLLAAAATATGPERVAIASALRQSASRVRTLAIAGNALAQSSPFIVWQYNPWAWFDPLQTLPSPSDRTVTVRLGMCRDEYRSVALNLTNVSGRALDVRVASRPWLAAGEPVTGGRIELRRAVTVPAMDVDSAADALPALDEGVLLSVPPYESRQLWVTVCTTGLKAGDYLAPLELKAVGSMAAATVLTVRVKVHDVALPHPSPLHFSVWVTAGGDLGSERDVVLRDLVSHGVNVFLAPAPTAVCTKDGRLARPPDFAAHDRAVRRLSPHGLLQFIGPQDSLTGQPERSPQWERAFVIYVRAWAAHMAKLGLGYDQWALYPCDEPSAPYNATTLELVRIARLIRKADPRITIYADPTSGTTMESVRMLTGLIDIWQPSSELLERLGPELLPVAKRVGKEVWFYDAAGNAKTLSCLGIYRWRFWYAWKLGLTGVGWWVYAANSGKDRWEATPAGDFFASVYEGHDGPIPSKRWEATREGIQDYEYLWLLREAIRDAEARGASAEDVSSARKVLEEMPREVEQALARVGRRPSPTVDGVPRYDAAARIVDAAKEIIVQTCLSLK